MSVTFPADEIFRTEQLSVAATQTKPTRSGAAEDSSPLPGIRPNNPPTLPLSARSLSEQCRGTTIAQVKRRVRVMQGLRSFHSAWRTIQGIETVDMIRKGHIRWLAKDDIAGQAFISSLFSLAPAD
jgi:hypothetical protein